MSGKKNENKVLNENKKKYNTQIWPDEKKLSKRDTRVSYFFIFQ